MSIKSKVDRLEAVLGALDCPSCAVTAAGLNDTDEALEAFFDPCSVCGRQRTWLDLVDEDLERIVRAGGHTPANGETFTDDELRIIAG